MNKKQQEFYDNVFKRLRDRLISKMIKEWEEEAREIKELTSISLIIPPFYYLNRKK